MKYKTLLKAFVLTTLALAVTDKFYAQDIVIKFNKGEMSMEQSLLHLEAQTPYRVAFNRNKLDVNRKVCFTETDMSVVQALEHILSHTGYRYVVQGKYILILQSLPVEEEPIAPKSRRVIARNEALSAPPPIAKCNNPSVDSSAITSNPVSRRNRLLAPAILVTEATRVVPDIARLQPTEPYSSFSVPVETYLTNRLPAYAIKTNLPYAIATLTPNLGAEIGIGRRTTIELYGAVNPWRLQSNNEDNRKLAHLLIRPEFRYWLCERFNGHYFGIHVLFAHYNIGSHDIPLLFEKEYRYQGFAYGGGISYGYFLPFNKRLGMEFTVGAGVVRLDYDRFDCAGCEKSFQSRNKTYFGPTRAGINLVFNIK